MTDVKSPFLVVQNFISPLLCEQIVNASEMFVPDTDREDNPTKTMTRNEEVEGILFERLQQLIPQIENHFGVQYRGTEPMYVEWFPEESSGSLVCESSCYLRKKWVKTKDRDFSGILFLSDYQDNVPFDSEFEVYGGKLEFPQWGFGFNPQRGTLIIYPSGPHFINTTTKIHVGDLYQTRLHIATQQPFLFDAKYFPGDYRTWFKDTN
jgi:hypothetical protein